MHSIYYNGKYLNNKNANGILAIYPHNVISLQRNQHLIGHHVLQIPQRYNEKSGTL